MSTFTCFGCGKTVPLVQMDSHKACCKCFGQRNIVPDGPVKVVEPLPEKAKEGLEKWF